MAYGPVGRKHFETQGLDSALLRKGDEYIQNRCPTRHTFLVIRNGYLVFERYYRGRSAADLANIASICKNVVSALAGIAIEKGLIQGTGQHLTDFYTEYGSLFGDPRKREVRIRHLLSMTAGFQASQEGGWERSADWFQWILSRPMANDPGETFDYNTGLTHLLSGILTKVSRTSTAAFAEENLFGPLGIRQYRWERDPRGYKIGGYRLSMMPRDLAKLGYLFLRKGRWDGAQLISESWVATSTAMKFDNDPVNHGGPWGYSMNVVGDYGYAWWLRSMQGYGAFFGAGACGQDLFVVPALNLVVLTMASTETDSAEIGGQGFQLLQTYVLPAVQMQPPVFAAGGVVDAASYEPGAVPGSFATLFGANLTDRVRTWNEALSTGRTLPTELAGVTVAIAGRKCPISYAGPAQVTALVPPEVDPGEAEVELSNAAGRSALSGVRLRRTAPGVFAVGRMDDGRLLPAALFPGTAVLLGPRRSVPGAESRPARAGEAFELYCSGLGPTREPDPLATLLPGPPPPAPPPSGF